MLGINSKLFFCIGNEAIKLLSLFRFLATGLAAVHLKKIIAYLHQQFISLFSGFIKGGLL